MMCNQLLPYIWHSLMINEVVVLHCFIQRPLCPANTVLKEAWVAGAALGILEQLHGMLQPGNLLTHCLLTVTDLKLVPHC